MTQDLYKPDLGSLPQLKSWLRLVVARYRFNVTGIQLSDGTVLPLPGESSLIAKLMEVTILNHFRTIAVAVPGVEVLGAPSGRVFPDLLLTGDRLSGRKISLDVKSAQITKSGTRTESRITLGPYDKYFRNPTAKMSGSWLPYGEMDHHLDLIVLYRYAGGQVSDVEPLIVETWRVASASKSSGTRNYIGAVTQTMLLREERGEFTSEEAFYEYWRNYPHLPSAGQTETER